MTVMKPCHGSKANSNSAGYLDQQSRRSRLHSAIDKNAVNVKGMIAPILDYFGSQLMRRK